MPNVFFEKVPSNLQLFARNSSNFGHFEIIGKIKTQSYSYASLKLFKEKELYSYQKIKINYSDNEPNQLGTFYFRDSLYAELSNYFLEIYIFDDKNDSLIIKKVDNIVAGDAFLVSGQSNSYNRWEFSGTYSNPFSRTFGRQLSSYENYEPYNPSDTLWSYANSGAPIGQWVGFIVQKIIENHHIPVCVINEGSGGSSMSYNLRTNPTDKFDLSTSLGKLFYRTEKAGLTNNIRYLIYRQGENDAGGFSGNWSQMMLEYWEKLSDEFPNLELVYLPQINVIEGNFAGQSDIREQQRKVIQKFDFIKGFATVGTVGHDGVHYSTAGNQQNANEIYSIIAEDFYGEYASSQNQSPMIKKAFFNSADKLSILIEFDQDIILSNDTLFSNTQGQNFKKDIRDLIYFNRYGLPTNSSNSWFIIQTKSIKNFLFLELFQPPPLSEDQYIITYLPAYSQRSDDIFPFNGQLIKNEYGMRAYGFSNIPILNFDPERLLDDDKDGIFDILDECLNTPLKEEIDQNGCSVSQQDSDYDGVNNKLDKCPETIIGTKVGEDGCELILGVNLEKIKNPFPNPFKDNLTIQFDDKFGKTVNIEIIRIDGSIIFKKLGVFNGQILNLKNISNGVYLLNIKSNQNEKLNQIKIFKN